MGEVSVWRSQVRLEDPAPSRRARDESRQALAESPA
jgi:hypothetical protein